MVDLVRELAVRTALFGHLEARRAFSADGLLTWQETAAFDFDGETYAMRQTRGRGIHKPRQLAAALSITTAFTPYGADPPYADSIGEDGYPRYKYEGTDPGLPANRALRAAGDHALPLAYFVGVGPAVYDAVYPVYVVGEDPAAHEFTLGFSRGDVGLDTTALSAPERVYAARLTKQRLHQPVFRQRVLHAYRSRCTVCRLRHADLLDAAHIIGDAEEGGDPVLPNGLAMCKIHHAAFDSNILGITPGMVVEISRSLLDEIDGPMLRHGLQEMHGVGLELPRRRPDHPDRERLARRYETFRLAS
jgi:putative restriction endonuclease